MAKTNVAFRISEEDKAYLYDLAEKNGVTITKFFEDVCELIKRSEYSSDGFKNEVEPKNEVVPVDINLDELRKIAEVRRETPQSVLDNALRPYRV